MTPSDASRQKLPIRVSGIVIDVFGVAAFFGVAGLFCVVYWGGLGLRIGRLVLAFRIHIRVCRLRRAATRVVVPIPIHTNGRRRRELRHIPPPLRMQILERNDVAERRMCGAAPRAASSHMAMLPFMLAPEAGECADGDPLPLPFMW